MLSPNLYQVINPKSFMKREREREREREEEEIRVREREREITGEKRANREKK